MIHYFAKRFGQMCIQNGLPEEKREIYSYGFECILIELLGNILLFVLAGFFGFFWHAVLWTLGLSLVRHDAGGYHAQSQTRCLLISTLSGLFFSGLAKYIVLPNYVIYIFLGISIVILFFAAPVGSKQKPLTDSSRKLRIRRLSIITSILSVVVIILSITLPNWIAASLASGIFTAALTCLIGKIINLKVSENRSVA